MNEIDDNVALQLGDIIRLFTKENNSIDNNEFYIHYIDNSEICITNTITFVTHSLILEDGEIQNESIYEIHLLSRSPDPGYATQNGFVPDTWINIYFNGDIPLIVTGIIQNLEEDMIEIKTVQDDTFYINFEYKGIPKELSISRIEIRNKPITTSLRPNENETAKKKSFNNKKLIIDSNDDDTDEIDAKLIMTPDGQKETSPHPEIPIGNDIEISNNRNLVELNDPNDDVKLKHEYILKGEDIIFGKEYLAPMVQNVEINERNWRYPLDEQIVNLIDDILSEIPNDQRESRMSDITIQTERFKQLLKYFSIEDESGNLVPKRKTALHKPLLKQFETFSQHIQWILPVVRNIKKMYLTDTDEGDMDFEDADHINVDFKQELIEMNDIVERYRENGGYDSLHQSLTPHFMPFKYPQIENKKDIIHEVFSSYRNTEVIVSNLNNLISRTFDGQMKFHVMKYTTGLNKIDSNGSGRTSHKVVQMTQAELMNFTSFLFLPLPVMKYSKLHLNNTSILDKVHLSHLKFAYNELFKSNVKVQTFIVDDTSNEDDFLQIQNSFTSNKIKHITFKDVHANDNNKFMETISKCLPKSKQLFARMREQITHGLTIFDVLRVLEPFLIYSDDITYYQYKNITGFLRSKIKDFNKTLISNKSLFDKIQVSRDTVVKNIFNIDKLITEENNSREFVMNDYKLYLDKTSNEQLKNIIQTDDGKLFFTTLWNETVSLQYPQNFTSLFEDDKNNANIKINKNQNNCDTMIITKSYTTVSELEQDNGKTVFFDKRYDKTDYSFLDSYENELLNKTTTEFKDFLFLKIKNTKKGITDINANHLVETLINGHQQVSEGDFAILYNGHIDDNYVYYKRVNNKWVKDDTNKQFDIDDDNVICDLNEQCIYNDEINSCENTELNKFKLKDNLLKNILNEFDEKYYQEKIAYEIWLKTRYEFYKDKMFPSLQRVFLKLHFQYNNLKVIMTTANDSTVKISPYYEILNEILKTENLVKKQKYIIRFKNTCLRDALPDNVVNTDGKIEEEQWLYCNATGVKLLPSFRYELACSYVKNIHSLDKYNLFLEQIISNIGEKSDNGTWVDKFSGSYLKNMDFDTDEGYDEDGFHVSTRTEIEQDAGNSILTTKKIITKEMQIIDKIIISMKKSMGIQMNNQETVVKWVVAILNTHMESEDVYKDRIKQAAKRDITIPSFSSYYNTSILYYTIAALIICIQTQIPSVKVKDKSSFGCLKSFKGYPFEGAGNMQCIDYFTCLLYKMKVSYEPWNVLLKTKEDSIAKKIKNAVDSFLKQTEVQDSIRLKEEYLLTNKNLDFIPEEHSLHRLSVFLPPQNIVEVNQINDVTSDFKKRLTESMKSGTSTQIQQILVLHSKQILYSIGILAEIQKTVSANSILFQNSLENSCCSRSTEQSALQYFLSSSELIKTYNDNCIDIENILRDIDHYTSGSMLLSSIKNTHKSISLGQKFDETTIYMAFIHFCNFRTTQKIHSSLNTFCSEKPSYINKTDSIHEIIFKLKNDDHNYNEDMLRRLLQTIGGTNVTKVVGSRIQFNSFLNFSSIVDKNIESYPTNNLFKLLKDTLDSFDIAQNKKTKETKELNNYLYNENKRIQDDVKRFIDSKNSFMKSSEKKKLLKSFEELSKWMQIETEQNNSMSNDVNHKTTQFYKSYITNFCVEFPNMVLNKVDFSNIKVSTHWLLSTNHRRDIKQSIHEFYHPLEQFFHVSSLTNVLTSVRQSMQFILEMSRITPTYSTTYNTHKENLTPIFDEYTSELLFKHYLFIVLEKYVIIANSINDPETSTNVAKLLSSYLSIMIKSKKMMDFDYQRIKDKSFKAKEYEKNGIRDRLYGLNEEQRYLDTTMKSLQLGIYNVGLQKGLTVYDKNMYESERDFRHEMNNFEEPEFYMNQDIELEGNENYNANETYNQTNDDDVEQLLVNENIEFDAFDLTHLNEDFGDGYDPFDDFEE